MMKLTNHNECTGCGACAASCPSKAISMILNKEGFYYPVIDNNKCIDCGACFRQCPSNNDQTQTNGGIGWYAAWKQSKYMPKECSSGGAGDAIASVLLELGWKISGAAFDESWHLRHTIIDEKKNLKQIRGSKYTQSETSHNYEVILEGLRRGEKFAFFGTPCECAGLVSIIPASLRKNVLIVDFICHGVPSTKLFTDYLAYLENINHSKVIEYNFRSKHYGWKKMAVSVKYKNKTKNYRHYFCPFHTWFGDHLSLRDSCFTCKYRSPKRISDITIADFWSVEKYYPEFPLKQGISAVQVNSELGKSAFERLFSDDSMIIHEVSEESMWGLRKNKGVAIPIPGQRDKFFEEYSNYGIEKLVEDFPAYSFVELVIDKIRSDINKVKKRI